MQRSSLLSLALVVSAVATMPAAAAAAAAQEDPAEVVAQQRTLAVWSSISQQTQIVDAQLLLAKKKQELDALQGSSQRARASLSAAETARRETGMPVVARISGDASKLFAVVTYPDGREAEVGVGDRLRGSNCRVESVSDSPEIGVPVRCGKKKTQLRYASGHSVPATVASPGAAAAPQSTFASAQLSPPAMVPTMVGMPPPGAGGQQVKAQ